MLTFIYVDIQWPLYNTRCISPTVDLWTFDISVQLVYILNILLPFIWYGFCDITWVYQKPVFFLIFNNHTYILKQNKENVTYSNITSFFRFVDKRAIYRWYNLIRTYAGKCDWLFHWQHKLCATFSANVNINYRLPIKVYYRICTLRHVRIEIDYGNQNVFWVLTWAGGY